MRKTWLTEKEGTAELDLCGPHTCREHITIRGLSGEVLRIFEGTERADRAWKEDTIYNGTQPLIRMENTGEGTEAVQALHHDHLGSIRQVTEWQGQQVSRHRYYPFGQEATPTSATDPVHKFTGHERDPGFHPETPLDYLHARYCNPVLGRFLSVDPARESGKADRPQSWNRFSYVVNNPLRYIDPDGRQVLAPKSVGERLEANAELREDISKSLIEVPGIGGVLVKVADAILSTIAPSTPEELSANLPGMVVPGAAGFGGSKLLRPLISRIKENPGLVRQAERAGKSAQRELDSLVDQLQRGNLNPGIGNKPIASGILEARARGGARVFFRPNADNIEILGKATKGNQGQVIDLVLDTFGND